MNLLRSFHKLSFVLVLLSIVGASIAQRSVGLLLIAGALAAISWYLTEGPRGRWLPKWVSNVLVIAVSLNVLVDLTQNPDDMLGVLGRFVLWLMIIKLYERRTARDHAHLLGLSVLLMIAGCLQTVDLFFGLLLGVYVALGLYVLLLFQLHVSYERSKSERVGSVPPDYRLAPAIRPITGRRLGTHFRSLVTSILVLGFVLGMVVFVLFPRGVGEGVVSGMPRPSQDRRPGFASEVNLFTGGRITDSRRAVMSVQFTDHEGNPFVAADPLLLRGAVLDRYEGRGRWRASSGAMTDLRVGPDELRTIVPDPVLQRSAANAADSSLIEPERVVAQHFEMLHNYDTLFSIYPPVAVTTDQDQTLRVDRSKLILRQRDRASRLTRYTVQASPNASDETMARLTAPQDSSAYMLRLRNAQVRELAEQLLNDAGVNIEPPDESDAEAYWQWVRDASNVFNAYFHSGEFIYSLDLGGVVIPERNGRRVDPIRFFLLELKRGHCEYFASALVALCYNVGIDARLVVGYVAYDYDGSTQRYNIVEANAHAWVEVRTGERRWTTVDPTPPAILRELHQGSGTMADRLRWFYDSFDGVWGRTVVDFDRAQQTRMADAGWTTRWNQRLTEYIESMRAWMDRVNRALYLGPAGYIYMAFVACVLLLAIGVLIRLMRRSLTIKRMLRLHHVRGREYQRMLRQLGFYLDMLTVLRRAGLAKPDWQPPQMHGEELMQSNPDVGRIVQELTELFYAVRYGHQPLTRDQHDSARAKVRSLANTLNVRY
jgi:transglutaminase-like putative cysteine protease